MENLTYISYKDKLPVLTHKLAAAVAVADGGNISMFVGDRLIFSMYKTKVEQMMRDKSIIAYVESRKEELGIKA